MAKEMFILPKFHEISLKRNSFFAEILAKFCMWHGNAAWTRSMDMQHGLAAWACSMDMNHGFAAWICSMEM
jgi:hypothetical protein